MVGYFYGLWNSMIRCVYNAKIGLIHQFMYLSLRPARSNYGY